MLVVLKIIIGIDVQEMRILIKDNGLSLFSTIVQLEWLYSSNQSYCRFISVLKEMGKFSQSNEMTSFILLNPISLQQYNMTCMLLITGS